MQDMMTGFDLKAVFGVAEGYTKSANVLIEHCGRKKDKDVVHSVVVLQALALENYLKCLYFLDYGKIYDGHNLRRLFDSLDAESQRQVRAHYDNFLKTSKFIELAHAKHKQIRGDEANLDFDRVLDEWAEAFEEWSYVYEARHRVGFLAFPEIRNALHQRITQLDPSLGKK